LRKRYNIIPLADYVRACVDGRARKLPPKSLIITMDDGHRSNARLREADVQLVLISTRVWVSSVTSS